MSTPAEIRAPSAHASPAFRILRWVLFIVLLILAGAATYAWFVAYSALPQLDGRLQIGGLSAPVTVTRDGHGVPTIEAGSLEDLFFAQGYVTAQDRLWQMDMMRRFGSGELSEILGEGTLKKDREQRILGLRAVARKSLRAIAPAAPAPAAGTPLRQAWRPGTRSRVRRPRSRRARPSRTTHRTRATPAPRPNPTR